MADKIIQIRKADDMHLHVREGKNLPFYLAQTWRSFSRAVIMPNLLPPVDNLAKLLSYRQQIVAAIPCDVKFSPLMTLYLTTKTKPQLIEEAIQEGLICAVKLYPHGSTTQSQSGLRYPKDIFTCAEVLQKLAIPLLIHAEDPNPEIDIFDREKIFIDNFASKLVSEFPDLKIVIEHISCKEAVDFVKESDEKVVATVTPQHLMYTRNAIFNRGLRPHYYCLPILKSKRDREAIQKVVLDGNRKFFLGTDSAPHLREQKENDCGCAGIFSAPVAIESYAEFFAKHQSLEKLENFSSVFGADFYGLPYNTEKISLVQKDFIIPKEISFNGKTIVPFRAGELCQWQLFEN